MSENWIKSESRVLAKNYAKQNKLIKKAFLKDRDIWNSKYSQLSVLESNLLAFWSY